jgi:phosphatidylglycerophosphate synthase
VDGWLTLGLTLPAMVAVALAVGLPSAVAGTVIGALALVALGCFARTRGLRFGLANGVTLSRLELAGLVILAPLAEPGPAPWIAIGLASTAMALDTVDGWAARRFREVSSFGARFDMEADTALLAALASLSWLFGTAGAWVLAAPLFRPAFVLTARIWPWLLRPLPPSPRRKLCCGVPLALLICGLAPFVPHALSTFLAAAAVGLLAFSFAADVLWLRARRAA